MQTNKKRIGLDVGGSHVSASVIDMDSTEELSLVIHHKKLDSSSSTTNILQTIGSSINELLSKEKNIEAIGIAFPGPFDYEKGVSAIAGVGGKFAATFGVDVGQALKNICKCNETVITFSNDAHCFAVGANYKFNLCGTRKIFLTLGTGFGAAFMEKELLLTQSPDMPSSGTFYDQPFLNSIADDYFSTRWILNEYKLRTKKEITSVKEFANSGTILADTIFAQFGRNLGAFLLPWLQQFKCDELVIGGNIARAYTLFGPSLFNCFQQLPHPVKITYCQSTEECILKGAAYIAGNNIVKSSGNYKAGKLDTLVSVQPDSIGVQQYNSKTIFHSDNPVYSGFESLAKNIADEKLLLIDGTAGVQWDNFKSQLNIELLNSNKTVLWYDINSCLKDQAEIEEMIQDNVNYNYHHAGRKFSGTMLDFFDIQKLELLIADANVDIAIVYGTGAALSNIEGKVLYIDMPKNEIQLRLKEGYSKNFATKNQLQPEQSATRFSLIDWPVINEYKEQLLTKISIVANGQRSNEITWMEGEAFRETLVKMYVQSLGENNYYKNKDWLFDPQSADKGIVIEGDKNLLSVSFEFLPILKKKKANSYAAY
jgi:predicted NBD/HSP70 family sugar kinase